MRTYYRVELEHGFKANSKENQKYIPGYNFALDVLLLRVRKESILKFIIERTTFNTKIQINVHGYMKHI